MRAAAPWRAVLVPDEGRSCFGPDFFRSEHHLRAEGVTHSLVLEGPGRPPPCLPLIVRAIPGTPYRDAVSPYGFPGAALPAGVRELPRDAVDWRGVELVSIFVRDRIGGPCVFAGATARSEVLLIDPHLPVAFRKSHRHHIRRNAELGYTSHWEQGPGTSPEARAEFQEVYRQTMVRDQASPTFYYPDAYFAELFASPAAWLVTTRAPDGCVASAALNVLSDGLLHNYLGGTADAHLKLSPAKNVIAALTQLAQELDVPVHLGGGLRPGDGIEHFKRGFANATSHYFTHELVCEPSAYAALCRGHAPSPYFPLYRAPGG